MSRETLKEQYRPLETSVEAKLAHIHEIEQRARRAAEGPLQPLTAYQEAIHGGTLRTMEAALGCRVSDAVKAIAEGSMVSTAMRGLGLASSVKEAAALGPLAKYCVR